MKKLSVFDSGWLQMESRETPMHVGGLQLYKKPKNAGPDFLKEYYDSMINVPGICPPFNQKLHIPAAGVSQASWVEDKNFDIGYHVRHTALPKPGRIRELLVLASRLHSQLLDKNRPLWECYLIEGLEDGRFALFFKMHHSMIDGVAGMRLMQSRMSTDADAVVPAPWSSEWLDLQPKKERKPRAPKPDFMTQLGGGAEIVKGLGQTAKEIYDMHRNPGATAEVAPYQAPKSILNQRVSGSRRFVADSWSLSRIKNVAKATDSTLNDIILAMCGGCLREYMLSQNALPDQPLVANIPVSIRPAEQADEGGNAISVIQANMGTHLADPIERLNVIKESMQLGKQRLGRMSKTEMEIYTALANLPFTIGQALPIGGRVRPMYNVVVSNVPGPKETLYINGAELVANYPASLCFNGYALNMTVTSYKDQIDFGLTACRRTLPSVQRMLDHLESSLAELEGIGKK